MNPWRLEWLRMTRSPRGLVLVLVYLFFGFTGPLLVKYMGQIARYASSGVQIIAPTPRAVDGIVNYVNQVSQTGVIVVVVVATGALAIDAHRGLATFYRTRVPGLFALIWPRFVVASAAAAVAYLLGTAAAWLETGLVLGGLPVRPLLLGTACELVYLTFAVATVAAAASVGRGALGTIGISLGVLLVVLPLLDTAPGARDWVPATLMRAPAALLSGASAADYLGPVAVSLLGTAGMLGYAVWRSARREPA